MSRPLRAVAVLTALGLAIALSFWTVRDHDDATQASNGSVSLGRIAPVSLTTASNCPALLTDYRRSADLLVGPYGLGGRSFYPLAIRAGDPGGVSEGSPVVPGAAQAQAGSSAQSAAGIPDSSTNVQVAGVDESDVVKTAGNLMVSALNGAVRITRLNGRQTKTLATWHPAGSLAQSILLDGTTAVVIGSSSSYLHPIPSPVQTDGIAGVPLYQSQSTTDLTVLDLSDPAHPRPVRRLEIAGSLSGDARLVDGELRLAVTAGVSGLNWKQPNYGRTPASPGGSGVAERSATQANRKIIAGSSISNWIPQATVTELTSAGKPDGPSVRRPLLGCNQVAAPKKFSGLNTLALVSVDLRVAQPLSQWRAAGVIADGSTLYATADHAWLATSQWDRSGSGSSLQSFAPVTGSTQIHLIDTPLRAEPRYLASGQVSGTLLNQFAMDEQNGYLRVASTTGPGAVVAVPQIKTLQSPTPQAIVTPIKPSEGRITVLRIPSGQAGDAKTNGTQGDAGLVPVGVLTGLGAGEQIRSVRFDGDVGYVVTYRQTDPLYTVDLSDPAHPVRRGELKLSGYSAYLHPAGPGRVLGLGQDGTTDGAVTGLQLSLFDVGDLSTPKQLARTSLNGAWSDAEADHHAFTMVDGLALVPYTSWSASTTTTKGVPDQKFDTGVIAVRVTAAGLGTPVVLRPIANKPITVHEGLAAPNGSAALAQQATPTRTVVSGGMIYTLTPMGVAVHNASNFDRLTFAKF